MNSPGNPSRPTEPEAQLSSRRRESFVSQDSQTAKEYIDSQLQLEADAREVLPYSFDSCTQELGPLRQTLFACLTCNPPPSNSDDPYTSAAVCYSCSISCHGEHTLVELFTKRNFICDCGTTRFPEASTCSLRMNPTTRTKGVHSQKPAEGNKYNHNFRNRFCGCEEEYDPHKEKGTMFQCLGLGSVDTGGCGEDWWHPECLLGLPRGWQNAAKEQEKPKAEEGTDGTEENKVGEDEEETPLPPGFPDEDDFDTFICYKCLDSNPWLKRYAGTKGFLPPVYRGDRTEQPDSKSAESNQNANDLTQSRKRKAKDEESEQDHDAKRSKGDDLNKLETIQEDARSSESVKHKHESLPEAPVGTLSLFLKEDFREQLCQCQDCFHNLVPHPQLREEEEPYEPPLSEDGDEANGGGSQGTGSLLDRGEAALSNIDRVRAIEGAMVYNHLRDKVKAFLKPFAESGQAVGADDIKSYFEKLRGDDLAIKEAGGQASAFSNSEHDDDNGENGGNRKEQSGY
ncbi:putative metaphase-anaphase transition protein [Talaromyces proteolyticus]|uniref:Metaphase-anaphase transition protein n=1 Tax=Talaromyces proteolyticus TaxID=1131652 RepID=A0AAD4KQS9_9EURO|nr:putative metaphase-anaphase transition protein [Talaromyces proteolyticus]KAH8695016.1 putative metaphase-anaphase transition protein [Talaromyces proteolyticus]